MGFIALGLFSLNGVGIEGSVMQMVNHGLTTGALFACVGIVYQRYHTREMGELGGLWNRLPLFAFFLIFASLGSAALPGLNGFVGEFPILIGTYASSPRAAIWASLGMILGAYYLLTMLQKVVFGPLKEPGGHGHGDDAHVHSDVTPVSVPEILGLAPLMILILVIGIYPSPFYRRISPSVTSLVKRIELSKTPPTSSVPRFTTSTNLQLTQPLRILTDARPSSPN
jgi:NADH-quinone oxidoreductase subunit M